MGIERACGYSKGVELGKGEYERREGGRETNDGCCDGVDDYDGADEVQHYSML